MPLFPVMFLLHSLKSLTFSSHSSFSSLLSFVPTSCMFSCPLCSFSLYPLLLFFFFWQKSHLTPNVKLQLMDKHTTVRNSCKQQGSNWEQTAAHPIIITKIIQIQSFETHVENGIDEPSLEQNIDQKKKKKGKVNQHSLKNKKIIQFYYMLNGILVTQTQ